MTRTLHLLRHAKADSSASDGDHSRPLDARGTRAAARMGRHLAELGAHPQRVVCSSARRAVETLAGLSGACELGSESVVVSDRLYLASAGQLLEVLRELPAEVESALLVAHNPGMHELAVALAGEVERGERDSYDRLRAGYPTAGLCELVFDGEWSELGPNRARLVRFDVPKRLTTTS